MGLFETLSLRKRLVVPSARDDDPAFMSNFNGAEFTTFNPDDVLLWEPKKRLLGAN